LPGGRSFFSSRLAATSCWRISAELTGVNELLAAKVLMRQGHGLYGVTDAVVQEIWRDRQR